MMLSTFHSMAFLLKFFENRKNIMPPSCLWSEMVFVRLLCGSWGSWDLGAYPWGQACTPKSHWEPWPLQRWGFPQSVWLHETIFLPFLIIIHPSGTSTVSLLQSQGKVLSFPLSHLQTVITQPPARQWDAVKVQLLRQEAAGAQFSCTLCRAVALTLGGVCACVCVHAHTQTSSSVWNLNVRMRGSSSIKGGWLLTRFLQITFYTWCERSTFEDFFM